MSDSTTNITSQGNPAKDDSPGEAWADCNERPSGEYFPLAPSGLPLWRKPAVVALGALALGAGLGSLITATRRGRPTLGERLVDEPLQKARGSIHAALEPVAHRLHDGYDAAREGVGRTKEMILRLRPSHPADSRLSRLGRRLNLW